MATLNSHGAEPQEIAIMDLWDMALSVDEIAARLGIEPTRVDFVTCKLGDGTHSDRWALRVPAASAKLANAIARAHPEMVAA